MARGRYSKPRQLKKAREERARSALTADGWGDRRACWRLHCAGCGAWLVEVDQYGSIVAVRGHAAGLYLDGWRELGEPDARGMVLIDFDMDDVVDLEMDCPKCGRRLELGNHGGL